MKEREGKIVREGETRVGEMGGSVMTAGEMGGEKQREREIG